MTAHVQPVATPRRSLLAGTIRLVQLHLASRRATSELVIFIACGILLRADLYWHWTPATGAIALTCVAIAVLAAGAAGLPVAGGYAGIARNVAGLTGLGLIAAPVLGGALSWIAPVACGGLAEYAIAGAWTSPWTWPAQPPNDHGAALCAALACATGLVMITTLGPRYRDGD
jgi:hypothetical protein